MMSKKKQSDYEKFVDALLEVMDEFIKSPKNKLTLTETIGAMYAAVRVSEMYIERFYLNSEAKDE